jgi:hypothetical protein
MKTSKTLTACVCAVLLAAACASSERATETPARAPDLPVAEAKPYPLTTCAVMPEHALGDKTVVYMHEGREVRFCCKGCIAKFQADPQTYLARIDAAAAK